MKGIVKAPILFVIPLAVSAQITSISGFRANDDPFATQGVLEVISAQSPVSGLNGAQASVTVACNGYEPNAVLSFLTKFAGGKSLRPFAALGFKIRITGVDLDIETQNVTHTDYSPLIGTFGGVTTHYATQDRFVRVKMRFDGDETIESAQQATDTHHIEFGYFDVDHANQAQRLLLGVSGNGHNVNLQLSLNEVRLKNVIQQCVARDKQREIEFQKAEAQKAAQQQAADQQRAQEHANINSLRNQSITVRASDTPTAQSVTAGPETQSRKPTFRTEPKYPPLAKAARIGGVVEFDAVIGPNGKVQRLTLVRGHPMLVASAREAIMQWQYDPPTANGAPISVQTKISILFDPSK
jgi:TonB family protein